MFVRLRKYFFDSEATILEIFKPLYVLLSLFGLFPYSVKFKTKHSCVIRKRSIYINSLCAVSMILILLAFMALHIRGIILLTDGNSLTDVIMTEINYILELQTLTIVCLVSYYCAFLYRHTYVKVLNSLASLSVELSSNDNIILKSLKLDVIKIILSLILIVILQVAVNYTRHDSLWKKILVTLSFNFPQMIQFIVLAFYYALVLAVIALLLKIGVQLKQFKKDKKNKVQCFMNVDIVQSDPSFKSLELAYVKVFDVKRSINKAFQAPILVTTVQCFHSMVSEAHIIYHGVLIHRVLNTHEIINCSIWIAYQIFKIYFLAYSGNLLKIQTYKLGQILHNIPVDTHDLGSYLQIQHFANLMTYQATDLTVYGFFPLDATLMFKVIASATMYLIIMVQFDKQE